MNPNYNYYSNYYPNYYQGYQYQYQNSNQASPQPTRPTQTTRQSPKIVYQNVAGSSIEDQIRRGGRPIQLPNDASFVKNAGGYLLNENETINWRGNRPISEYSINNDKNPDIVQLKYDKCVDKVKRSDYKYLQPPKVPTGKIEIIKKADQVAEQAPPMIIRIPAATRASTPPPVIHRERPPTPPAVLNERIVIPGAFVLPPRRVVTEKLAEEPASPQGDIVETWKPYQNGEINVSAKRETSPQIPTVKNTIYQWEKPCVNVRVESRNLGEELINPNDYVRKYGKELKNREELPASVSKFLIPRSKNIDYKLVGDVNALESLRGLDWERLVQNDALKSAIRDYFSRDRN